MPCLPLISVHIVYKSTDKVNIPRDVGKLSRASRNTFGVFIYFTDTGYVDNDCFELIASDFRETWALHYPGLHALVLGDNLGVHVGNCANVVREGLAKGFHHCFLPPGTTQWSQPLDNLLFARVKTEIRLSVSRTKSLSAFSDSGTLPFSIVEFVYSKLQNIFTPALVKASFEVCGVYPFSYDVVLDLAAANHRHDLPEGSTPRRIEMMNLVKDYLGAQKKEASELTASTLRVKPRRPRRSFTPQDLIDQQKEEEEAKERANVEKEVRAREREEKRVRNEEEKVRGAVEKKRKREETKQASEDAKRRRAEDRKARSCKAGCGGVYRSGNSWTGCEHCETHWICPKCWKSEPSKRMMKDHERKCKRVRKGRK